MAKSLRITAASAHHKRHAEKAERWVLGHFARLYSVSPVQIKRRDKLKHWGIVHEGHFAELTGAFNRATLTDADWHKGAVAPPKLIAGLNKPSSRTVGSPGDRTVGNLIDAVAAHTSAIALAATSLPTPAQVLSTLLEELRSIRDDTVTANTNLDDLVITSSEGNDVRELFFRELHVMIDPDMLFDCIAECKTKPPCNVQQVASCMSGKIKSGAGANA